jgi:hypothetical protein
MIDSEAALIWIVNELTQRHIPFVIVGGLATLAYGGSRPLNDIDIDVPDSVLPRLANELKAHVDFGPEHSVNECFDCQILGISYLGQAIELGGADSLLIRDVRLGTWIHWPTDLSITECVTVLGVEVPVIRRDRLIEYKKMAGRETDIIDVRELEQGYNKRVDLTP